MRCSTGLLYSLPRLLSLYLQGKEKWQVWIVLQIWFVKPLPRVCATVALPSITTQWNKYALATVCIGPQHFSHCSWRSWSVCKLHSPEKPEKDEVGGVGGEEAPSTSTKHLSCDKSISVFNRVEKNAWKAWSPWMREQGKQGWISHREAINEAQLNHIMLTHPNSI